MKVINLFIFFIVTVFFVGCKKEAIESDFDLSEKIQSKSQNLQAFSAGDGQWDLLGYGYNILGDYAHSNSATFPIIDVERMKSEHPTYVIPSGAETATSFYEAGQNALEFSKKITGKIVANGGVDFLFKGNIDLHFNSTDKWSSKYIYGSYSAIAIKRRVKIINDIALMRNYLHQGFLNHLNTLSPAGLVSLYGTHVLIDIKLGGRMDVIYRAETYNSDRTKAATAGAKFSFLKIFGTETEGSYDVNEAKTNFNESAYVRTVGGSSAGALSTNLTYNSNLNPGFTFNASAWASGLTDENAELMDIAPNGIIPLYELISDATKRQQLKVYIDNYLAQNKVVISYDRLPVYQYYNSSATGYLFFTDVNRGSAYWSLEGEQFKAPSPGTPLASPIHEYWNEAELDWIWSSEDIPEINVSYVPNKIYKNEGLRFYGFKTQQPGTIPIYLHCRSSNVHFLSTTKQFATPMKSTKIAFYAYPKG
ncbi:MAC/perforin domain-containing protein [Sphingobacterium sp.]|uniref:MAC/perforin domain-containing protein n=1 Tax=Sphingobacterium sp. TaxID=341027 RepID=UPI0031DDC7DA